MGDAARDAGATRVQRLRAAGQFQAVFQHGKRIEQPSVVCLWRPAEHWSVGVAVSRQVRGAVKRNRIRRRLREAYRRAPLAGAGADVVLVGRPHALDCPFPDLAREVGAALAAIGARGRGASTTR